MSAMDLATGITLGFVESALANAFADARSLRLLEVGCGSGHLAQALSARGHRVLAIDSSEEAIAAARARGVDARVARFPELDEEPFDAVLFTRSLHHIPPLEAAVARARELLHPAGLLVIDDFAHNRVDRVTALWAYGYMKSLRALGLIDTDAWDETSDPLAAWRAKHEVHHALHGDDAMLAALERRFEVGPVERVEYFYRYLCRYLDVHPRGREVAEAMRWAELALVGEQVIQPIGMRLRARPR